MITLEQVNIPNIGRYTYCASQPMVWNPMETTIGSFVSIGMFVNIGLGHHPLNFLSSSPYFYLEALGFKLPEQPLHEEFHVWKPVKIGNDVWIGNNVTINNGLTIGDGAVIGLSSYVTQDVPPYAIVAGTPAKIIRYRYSPEIISELLELKWWNLDDEIIKEIPYDNINDAIKFLKKIRNTK